MTDKPYQKVVIDDPNVGEPELRLWRSVLLQAISDCFDKDEKREIMKWIPTKDFRTVCELADLDPDKIGRALAKVVLGKKPESILLANRLKMGIVMGSIELS